jgi:mannitol-1-phosphate 5-dehydrogenase
MFDVDLFAPEAPLMASRTPERTYVGFGFGAIQAGLFLYEGHRSGRFGRLVVAEVLPGVVDELRQNDGTYAVNIAHAGRIEAAQVGPVEVCDPNVAADRERLVDAVADAHEIGTAVPSVRFYVNDRPGSIHRVLAAGLRCKLERRGPRAVVYAAENHNEAAERLREAVESEVGEEISERVDFLNTVIGKMSGLAADPAAHGLATVTPGSDRAFLVEAFNRILVSRPAFHEPFDRGLDVFEERDDLLPFEEAKLYGHNATHALAAYLGRLLGVERIAELRDVPGMLDFLRDAFIDESGAALIRKHGHVDPLFTPDGWAAYADDLLERMTNPFLMDTVARVGRDPKRKLGWNDRLIGTMRVARSQDIEPRRFAFGAVAALAAVDPACIDDADRLVVVADPVWADEKPDTGERARILADLEAARQRLAAWRANGMPALA